MRYRIKKVGIFVPTNDNLIEYYNVQAWFGIWWTISSYHDSVHHPVHSLKMSEETTSFELEL